MRYHEIGSKSRAELEALIDSGNEAAIIDALLSAAYPDWKWVQGICLRFLGHADPGVRSNALICIGHIARIHKKLDLELVLPELLALKQDAQMGPYADEALADIHFFLGVH